MKAWKKHSQSVLHEGWRPIVKKTFEHPRLGKTSVEVNGKDNERDANMIVIDKNGMVIIARQFRCGPEKVMDEIAGGRVDEGETPQDAAIREMHEEVGYLPGSVSELGIVYRDGWKGGSSHYFLALDCVPAEDGQNLDEYEVIEVHKITISQLIENAKSGRMTDAGGVLLAYDKLKELEQQYEKSH